ncbi:hypothetical protein CL628_03780 [bacterium]|nr:hypothetical protein [bacterium]
MTSVLLIAGSLVVALSAITIGVLIAVILQKKRTQRRLEQELKQVQAKMEAEVEQRTDESHKARMRLMTALDNLPLGLVMSDNEDNIVYMNDLVGQLFSNRGEQSLEALLYDTLNVREKSQQCRRDLEACEPYIIEHGGAIIRVQVTPIIAETAIGTVATLEDIREVTQLQRTKDDFFAVASHELRTPLTAICGNAALIQQYFGEVLKAQPQIADMIDDMHTSSVRLIELVNDFLSASGLEQGRVDFNIESFSLIELIDDVIDEIKSQTKAKGIDCEVETSPNLPLAKADPNRVKQVLFNLIGNAIKFTDQGGVSVTAAERNGQFKVSVTDTGHGIAPESQSLLFQKFQQVGTDTLSRDVTKGSGLGLYISKLLIEQMGGTIELERSAPGEGSTFFFTLPIA